MSFFRDGGMQDVISGLREDLRSEGSVGARIGVAVAAVNIGGALFSISPVFSNLLAVLMAIIRPSWVSDIFPRVRERGAGTYGKGRIVSSISSPMSPAFNTPNFLRRYDRRRYHYFMRLDGTKRYYRTGQSMVSSTAKARMGKKFQTENSIFDKWRKPRRDAPKAKLQDGLWSLFQQSTR